MKRSYLKKRSKSLRAKLIAEMDTITREIVFTYWRKDGVLRCVVCGEPETKVVMQPGHLFSRGHLATRWDVLIPGNVFPQCSGCNLLHVRNTYPFNHWFQEMYGMKAFDELYAKWNTITHYKTCDLQAKKTELEALLADIKQGGSL